MDYGTYQLRAQTGAEDAEQERRREQRAWAKAEAVRAERSVASTSALKISQGGNVQFRDYSLGKSVATKSRLELDRIAYSRRKPVMLDCGCPRAVAVPSLRAICRNSFANSFLAPGLLDGLDWRFASEAPAMLDEICAGSEDRTLPFLAWLAFAKIVELPKNRRTYKGLVLADVKEVEILKLSMVPSDVLGLDQTPLSPLPTFIGILDLSCDSTLRDGDIWRIRAGIGPFLVVLKLPPSITDIGVSTIVSGFGHLDAYTRLEILSLRGCAGVTDRMAKKLSRLTTLRMLDIRNTKCTTRFINELNSPDSPVAWHAGDAQNGYTRSRLIEFELFNAGYSGSHTLTLLHTLALWIYGSRELASKPHSIQIDALTRPSTPSFIESNDDVPKFLTGRPRPPSGTNNAFHKAFGSVFSTVPIGHGTLEMEGAGSTMRPSHDDIASGRYIGEPQRAPQRRRAEEWSDDGSDGEREVQVLEQLRQVKDEALPRFYRPGPRPPRKHMVVSENFSPFQLLRHLPFPYQHASKPKPREDSDSLAVDAAARRFVEGAPVRLKRQASETERRHPPSSMALPERRGHVRAAPVAVRSSGPISPSRPNNPFAKRTAGASTSVRVPARAVETLEGVTTCEGGLRPRGLLAAFQR